MSELRVALAASGDRLTELAYAIGDAQASPRNGRRARVDAAHDAYNAESANYNRLRDQLSALENAQLAQRAPTENTPRRFVNSFGEASQRYVTSTTYERAQRRLEREVAAFLGR